MIISLYQSKVATVLTACGIETTKREFNVTDNYVATVLTACGIETSDTTGRLVEDTGLLQQYLPLAVLKPVQFVLLLYPIQH